MSPARAHRLVVDLASTSKNWSLPEWGQEKLLAIAPEGWDVHMVRASTKSDGDGGGLASAEVLEAVRDAEVYFGFGVSESVFAAAPGLRWVHSAAAGVGSALFPAMRQGNVLLTNSAGIMGDTIAEHVVGGVIYLLRSMDIAVAQQREARWDKSPFVEPDSTVREVSECTVLVVGTGGIGQGVGTRFTALGATCVGVRRRPGRGAPPGFARVVGLDALDEELPGGDVIVLCAPLTAETDGLLDARRLDCLHRGAIVVNVARGALLDEHALALRLQAGRIRGAVLDVFQHEPLDGASPLWALSQVLLTPHVAAVSPRRFWERALELFLDNWARYRAGESLRNLVDKDAGY